MIKKFLIHYSNLFFLELVLYCRQSISEILEIFNDFAMDKKMILSWLIIK